MIINEESRNSLMSRSKTAQRERDGLTRYQKRVKSKVASSNKQYNRINMNQLFKDGILTIGIEVHGETDNYIVKISYGGFLDTLRDEVRKNDNTLELRNIVRALVIAFNKEDVYIRCSCPDFNYRFSYWATKNEIITGEPELRPSDETNPNDNLGSGCKHIMLVLSNTSWIIKVASVIKNYISYMEKHMQKAYSEIIYPAVYGKKYEEPVQTSLFDKDELDSEQSDIDAARTKNQFKPGNKYRFSREDTSSEDQINMLDEPEEEDEQQ